AGQIVPQRRQLLPCQLHRSAGADGGPGHVPDQQRRVVAARGEEPAVRRPRQTGYLTLMSLEAATLAARADFPEPHNIVGPDCGEAPTIWSEREVVKLLLLLRAHGAR